MFGSDGETHDGDRPSPLFAATGIAAILTPNRVVLVARGAFATMLLAALLLGPETLGNMGLRFAIAYATTLFGLLSFPNWSIRTIAGGLTLAFAMRWTLGAFSGGTVQMLAVQMTGIACALAPIYARNVAHLSGASEGHISFTERRQLWQRHARKSGSARRPAAVPLLADLRVPSDG